MATYYVRKTGNDSNPGTTGSPWLTLGKAANTISGGDVVIVGDGTYTDEAITISDSGSSGAYTTFRAENKRMAISQAPGGPTGWRINITANYVEIDGIKTKGGAGHIIANWGVHHVYVHDCEMEDGDEHGFASVGGEFIVVEDNWVHGGRYDNFWSAISIYQARNVTGDTTTTGFRNIIRGNTCNDNTQTAGTATDGNGIILDDFQNGQSGTPDFATWADVTYPYPTLVENNVCFNNGGRGVQCVWSDHVTIRNNTLAWNVTWAGLSGTWWDNLSIQHSSDCEAYNNIAVCDRTQSTARAIGSYDNDAVWFNNLTYDTTSGGSSIRVESGGTTPVSGDGNVLGSNPLFVSLDRDYADADFRLQSGSPAINAGTAAFGVPSTDADGNDREVGTIDIGAYEFGSASEDSGMLIDEDAVVYLGSAQKYKVYLGTTVLMDQTPDSTAPTLSSPTDTANGSTAATGTVSTNEGNGTLYWVASTSGTAPTATQVKAGQMHTGAAAASSGSQAVSGTGVQTLSPAPSGLTASTAYTIHYMHEDAATNKSSVSSGDGFTTSSSSGITAIGYSVTVYGSRTNTTLPATLSAGSIQNNDIIMVDIVTTGNPDAPDPTAPAGFSAVGTMCEASQGSVNGEYRTYYKRASGESGDYTFTHSTSTTAAMLTVWRGVHTSTALDVTPTENTGTGVPDNTRTWTGLTTVTNGAMLIANGFDWGDTANGLTPPSGMTELVDTGTGQDLVYSAYEVRATAGATSNRTHTCNTASGTDGIWGARLIALRPA